MTRTRRGIALPMVMIFLFILVGALAASFTLVRGERRLNDAAVQTVSAYSLAESGLQLALQNPSNITGIPAVPPNSGDSGRVTLTGGYADVIFTRLRPASGTNIRGIELNLVAESPNRNSNTGNRESLTTTTAIFFRNRVN